MKNVSFCYNYGSNEGKIVSMECSDFHYSIDGDLYVIVCDNIRCYVPIHSLYYIFVEDI